MPINKTTTDNGHFHYWEFSRDETFKQFEDGVAVEPDHQHELIKQEIEGEMVPVGFSEALGHTHDFSGESVEETASDGNKMAKRNIPKEISNNEMLTRSFSLRAEELVGIDEDSRTVKVSVSSEDPVPRFGFVEILGHNASEVDLEFFGSGNAPLLFEHFRDEQLGVVESARIEKKRLTATIRFSKSARAEEIWRDVMDGIRTNVSVGYKINGAKLVKEDDDVDHYRITDWKPMEVSIVSIPADPSVGTNRKQTERDFNMPANIKENEAAAVDGGQQTSEAATRSDETKTSSNKEEERKQDVKVEVNHSRENERKAEAERVAEIYALANKFGFTDRADEWAKKGTNVNEVRGIILDKLDKETAKTRSNNVAVDLSSKERERFSLANAVRGAITGKREGYEFEVCRAAEEFARKSNIERTNPTSFFIPTSALMGQRAHTVGATNVGEQLVGTDHRGDMFIDRLKNELVLAQAGATVMDGLVGNVSIPKLTSGTTPGFLGETAATSESEAATTSVTMSPKRLGTHVDYSEQLLRQSDPSIDTILENDLMFAVQEIVDNTGLNGTGAGDVPTGVTNLAGLDSTSLAGQPVTYTQLVELKGKPRAANVRGGNRSFVTSEAQLTKWEGTQRFASSDGTTIYNPVTGMTAGVPALGTNLIADDDGSDSVSSTIIFGHWNHLMLGHWGVLEIIVDPYTQATLGQRRLVVVDFWDVAVRYVEAFAEFTLARNTTV